MGRSATELRVLRKQTSVFIAGDPTPLALSRREKESNGAGGWRFVGPPSTLDPQDFHVVAAGETTTLRQTADGRQVAPTHNVIGEWDADIRQYDQFDYNGKTYVVLWVNADLEYVTHAEAAPR